MSLLDRFAPGPSGRRAHLPALDRRWRPSRTCPRAPTCRARFEEFDQLARRHAAPTLRGEADAALHPRTPGDAAGADCAPAGSARASGPRHCLPEGRPRRHQRPLARPPLDHRRPPQPASSPASASASDACDIRSHQLQPADAPRNASSPGRRRRPEAVRPVALDRDDRNPVATRMPSRDRASRPWCALDDMTPTPGDLTERPQVTWPPPNR